jgi:hypothetical protein
VLSTESKSKSVNAEKRRNGGVVAVAAAVAQACSGGGGGVIGCTSSPWAINSGALREDLLLLLVSAFVAVAAAVAVAADLREHIAAPPQN